jgi:hypothetical protein
MVIEKNFMTKIEITVEISNKDMNTIEIRDLTEMKGIKTLATDIMIKIEETKTMETT